MRRLLACRSHQPETMDTTGLDQRLHERALRGLARVNSVSGTAGKIWPVIKHLCGAAHPRPVRILDLACGGGDVAVAIGRKIEREGLNAEIAGCDVSPTALRSATRRAASAAVAVGFFQADVIRERLPQGYDVLTCSLFLHHLDDGDAIALLRNMAQASRKAFVVSDLIRGYWGYLLAVTGTHLLTRSRIARQDGVLSVRNAFTLAELTELVERAGLCGVQLARCWPERYLLVWQRFDVDGADWQLAEP